MGAVRKSYVVVATPICRREPYRTSCGEVVEMGVDEREEMGVWGPGAPLPPCPSLYNPCWWRLYASCTVLLSAAESGRDRGVGEPSCYVLDTAGELKLSPSYFVLLTGHGETMGTRRLLRSPPALAADPHSARTRLARHHASGRGSGIPAPAKNNPTRESEIVASLAVSCPRP